MPSSTVEQPSAVAPTKTYGRVRANIDLIAWDPDSTEHVELLFQQRVACGWKSGDVEKWRGLQRAGKMAIQWVVSSFLVSVSSHCESCILYFPTTTPTKATKLNQHTTKYALESTPIHDTARTLGAKPRQPTSRTFTPVGHISLDSESPNEDQADASKGVYCITTFYISRAIQSGGLGSAAMDKIESEAVKEPLNAKVLSLDTLANSSHSNTALWREMEMEDPAFSNQDWYERRGYKPWKFIDGHIKQMIGTKLWPLNAVFMKKTVA
ncbi:uncharacterized protein RAG0_10978 [Rhynchosporium agropyri]|uniref:N-acetyltransferase domain-containing protein n=1 Tax=Rhynchosporium agropyri TaxID=914238 RepID=A0A1E1L225_9HELO|nr:uncharacterized protein RAG0_10978 [Rhynchosporium agropyri]